MEVERIFFETNGEVSHGRSNAKYLITLAAILLLFCGGSTVSYAQNIAVEAGIELPEWAPYYENANLVQYYYFPDIECYYDVRNRDFIYLEDGQWMFGRTLPPVYSWFDLYNCFVVALDYRVYEPWRHFHYYVAHYPRFYYRSVYKDIFSNHDRPLRGFNENERSVVYDRRTGVVNNGYVRRNAPEHETTIRHENANINETRREYPERRVVPTHPSEPIKYYGRQVGQPVRVEKQMRRTEDKNNSKEKRNREK